MDFRVEKERGTFALESAEGKGSGQNCVSDFAKHNNSSMQNLDRQKGRSVPQYSYLLNSMIFIC
jgi:hypothetical protein